MVAYEPVLHVKAQRELQALPDDSRDRITSLLKDIASYESPTTHSKCRHLEGHKQLFRVREGGVRAICKLEKPQLLILKIGERDTVYDGIDDIGERLESPA